VGFNLNLDETRNEKKYYWSPAVRWEKTGSEVKIEIFCYKEDIAELFPKFYFLLQKGIELCKLIKEFDEFDSRKLNAFVNDLIKKRVLIHSIATPQEIFYPQSYIFKNVYSENIKFDAEELKKFKDKQLNRKCESATNNIVSLECTELPEVIKNRRTYRSFEQNRKISFTTFSQFLSVLRQERQGDNIRYYYASAGGLYPIDIYLYVKENRVENIDRGLYYYNPIGNELCSINNDCTIPKEAHYFTNQNIFSESAVSMFFVYNAEVTMPKYAGMGYFYSAIDTGIMVSTLTTVGELNDIGICSIGDMNFHQIKKFFMLNDNQVLLHTVEIGLKSSEICSGLSDV